jgi:RsiW-degrading membrane proteinase PrsW (M82 family)
MKVNRSLAQALALVIAAIGATVWSVLAPGRGSDVLLVIGAVAAPIGVLLAVRARAGSSGRVATAALGGGLIGPIIAVASHAFVGAFAYAFFLGFADAGRGLLDALRLHPRLHDVLASPWVVLLLVDLAVVAPITEEAGKALGAFWFAPPKDRRQAFLTGVAAGTGFAVVENMVYVGLAAAVGGPWQMVVLARTLGAAVHPLASGLVAMGVHDRRVGGGTAAILRGYGAGVGVHALWNASLVVLAVASTVAEGPSHGTAELVQLTFSALLGAVLGAALWISVGRVSDEPGEPAWSRAPVAAWILLSGALLVPVVVIVLAFPSFYLGP